MPDKRLPPASRTDCRTVTETRKQAFWAALQSIPSGRVCSYGALAQLAGLGRGARLAGRWLKELPDGSALPWHRVVNSQGKLSLPADSPSGQEQMQRLLAEGVRIHNRRIDMKRYSWPDATPAQPTGQS